MINFFTGDIKARAITITCVVQQQREMDAVVTGSELNKSRSGGSERSDDSGGGIFEYSGWVYHLGVNSIGHEYCHLRFLFIRGKYIAMYKRDPHESPGIV